MFCVQKSGAAFLHMWSEGSCVLCCSATSVRRCSDLGGREMKRENLEMAVMGGAGGERGGERGEGL